jgi:beta-aspartyl-peptidase (threonine type)
MAVLAIHGGCGIMVRSGMSEADWADARLALARSLRAGWAVLAGGGSAVDAVEAAVVVMEDSPHFNAGYGAALNAEGFHELDATIMDGASLKAGAVAIAQGIRNPVKVARLIMDKGEAVIVGGKAADEYASRHGLEVVDNSYFTTERRVRALAAMKEHGRRGTLAAASESEKHGTVGAVALDAAGNLAAATSTGGYNNKPKGRIGDSPVPGAGTYARNGVCAVSGTGQGEFFITHAVGHQVACRVSYLGESLHEAAAKVIDGDLKALGVGAGLIAVDASGNVTASYNTNGMFRGWVGDDGQCFVATHDEVWSMD